MIWWSDQLVLKSGLLMESVAALVAEWISLGKMFTLQELSTPISDVLREWEGKEIMEGALEPSVVSTPCGPSSDRS